MESNKLIANFMGLETSDGCYFEHLTKEGNRELTHHILLEYHTSWDWLMPVVRNVLMTIELDGLDFATEELRYNTLDCDINGVYKEVVQFIKDYKLVKLLDIPEINKHDLVLKSIMTRYGGLTNLICQLREDSDVAYVNISDDTDMVVNHHEVEDIINQIIT